MARKTHKTKEIEAVLRELESLGWSVVEGKGHACGLRRRPANDKDCRCVVFCQMSVWSTLKAPERHANRLRQKAFGCTRLDQDGARDG